MLISKDHYFYGLNKKSKLARILNVDLDSFNRIDEYFSVFSFSKNRNGKTRRFHNQNAHYKKVLRRINRLLINTNIPSYVYSGVPNRDFLNNAINHSNSRYVLNVDIKNFFPTTHEKYVYSFFNKKCYMDSDVAKILTLLTTNYNHHDSKARSLPQGFPTSGILSYLAYFDMFNGIYKICKDRNIHFTIFVDDMTFSSNTRIPKSFLRQIKSIVSKYNLEVHPSKSKFYGNKQTKIITGIAIDGHTNNLKLPYKLQKDIHENFKLIHNHYINSLDDYKKLKDVVLSLKGQVNHAKRINHSLDYSYTTKLIKDIEKFFIFPQVKNIDDSILNQEYQDYMYIKYTD